MSEFIDDTHEEIVLEAECADETDGRKDRAETLYRWADAYRDALAEVERLKGDLPYSISLDAHEACCDEHARQERVAAYEKAARVVDEYEVRVYMHMGERERIAAAIRALIENNELSV